MFTGEIFKREELGEVKLSILKEGNDNACLECRDGHAHYSTRIIQLQTTAGCLQRSSDRRPIIRFGKHSSLKEKIRFDRRALFVTSLLQSRMPFSDDPPIKLSSQTTQSGKSSFEVLSGYAVARACPPLALNRHSNHATECPLLGVKGDMAICAAECPLMTQNGQQTGCDRQKDGRRQCLFRRARTIPMAARPCKRRTAR